MAGVTTCTHCPVGKWHDVANPNVANPGAIANHTAHIDTCMVCAKGQWNEWTAQITCYHCPEGKYQDATTFASCHLCHVGKFSTATERKTTCDLCIPGQFQEVRGKTSCAHCKVGQKGIAGTYGSDSETTHCSDCIVGTYTDQTARTVCKNCELGRFQPTKGLTSCIYCPNGKWQNITTQTSCIHCMVGRYGAPGVAESDAITHCKDCPMGKWQDQEATTVCDGCLKGRFNDYVERSVECTKCPHGKYQETATQFSCINCAFGKHGTPNEEGSFSQAGHCHNCVSGKYQDIQAKTTCTQCDKGTWSTDVGRGFACGECSRADSTRVVACGNCPHGKYQEHHESLSCVNCAKGKHGTSGSHGSFSEATHCTTCVPGTHQMSEAELTCPDCQAGRFLPPTVTGWTQVCDNCPHGKWQDADGATSCIHCLVGRFGEDGTSEAITIAHCTDCVVGKWQPTEAEVSCLDCPKGRFANSIMRSVACLKCIPGQYQPVVGITSCINCVVGKFGAPGVEGSILEVDHCSKCAQGQFQGEEAKTACSNCTSGQYTDDTTDHSSCTACAVRDSLRSWWTENTEGWNHCVKKPLDCLRGPEDAWTTCTQSCRYTIGDKHFGDKKQFSIPVYHAWGGGVACSAHPDIYDNIGTTVGMTGAGIPQAPGSQDYRVWHADMGAVDPIATYSDTSSQGIVTSEPARNTGMWEHKVPCNLHWCPIDCVVSPWTAWSTCGKRCGTGTTFKTRHITTPVEHGGKICPHFITSMDCNEHACRTECSDKHVSCHVHQWKFRDHYMNKNSMNDTMSKYGRGGRYNMPEAEWCKTKECMKTNLVHESIVVVHPLQFNSFETNFKCGIEDTSVTKCKCTCDTHPTGCYEEGKKWDSAEKASSQAIVGNWFSGVKDHRQCSDYCTNHPDCTHWQFQATGTIAHHPLLNAQLGLQMHASTGNTCILMTGALGTKTTTSVVTDYAGLRNENVEANNTCPDARPAHIKTPYNPRPVDVQCAAGTYLTVVNDVRTCHTCAAGTYTRYANMAACQEIILAGDVEDPDCCTQHTVECMSCHAGVGEVQYCALHPKTHGCEHRLSATNTMVLGSDNHRYDYDNHRSPSPAPGPPHSTFANTNYVQNSFDWRQREGLNTNYHTPAEIGGVIAHLTSDNHQDPDGNYHSGQPAHPDGNHHTVAMNMAATP